MGEKQRWNNQYSLSFWERRRRDPLYQFKDELFYTQEIKNGIMADIDNKPVKADRYGVFHGTSL